MGSKDKKIVVIGGGTGTYTVLSSLKRHPVYLSAIVSMSDDGGSTGVLREEFGILPPGDIRRALVALSGHRNELMAKLFAYRFKEGGVLNHNVGNLILTALERTCGGFEEAIKEASKLLAIDSGEVIPVTLSSIKLSAELEDGSFVKGEANIDVPKHNGEISIAKIWLEPKARANKKALSAIKSADLIVLGPGDLYTSILPNLIVNKIPEAIRESKAKKAYITNLTTKFGETNGFVAVDFINKIEEYLGEDVLDFVLVNTGKSPKKVLGRYRKENAFLVDPYTGRKVGSKKPKIIKTDLLRKGDLIRHDQDKLSKELLKLA